MIKFAHTGAISNGSKTHCIIGYQNYNLNKHNAELQRTDLGTKVTMGSIFPPNARNAFLLSASFELRKNTLE